MAWFFCQYKTVLKEKKILTDIDRNRFYKVTSHYSDAKARCAP